jgi:hypothetical protein
MDSSEGVAAAKEFGGLGLVVAPDSLPEPATMMLERGQRAAGKEPDVGAAAAGVVAPPPAGSRVPTNLRVLVVDSQGLSRAAVCALLRDCEYQVRAREDIWAADTRRPARGIFNTALAARAGHRGENVGGGATLPVCAAQRGGRGRQRGRGGRPSRCWAH